MKLHQITPALALFALTSLANAQTPPPNPSLTPPGAPADGVFKTLDQVEARVPVNAQNTPGDADSAFRISSPGSYFLTSNLYIASLGAGKSAIEIAASGVTLDLNGFTVDGAGATSQLSGITCAAVSGITIRNGTVTTWQGAGVALPLGKAVRIDGVTFDTNNIVDQVLSGGLVVCRGAIVVNCIARNNKQVGFVVSDPVTGGSPGDASIVSNCIAESNTEVGFYVVGGIVSGCLARENGTEGFRVFSTKIENCFASANKKSGIWASTACSIVGNTCYFNGVGSTVGAGIELIANDCRVEGNNLIQNDIGLKAISGGNLIIRNSMSGNTTNVDLVAGNKVGKIYSTPSSGAITGDGTAVGAGAGVGTTDPWANFTY